MIESDKLSTTVETQTTAGTGGHSAVVLYEDKCLQVNTLGEDAYDFSKVLLKQDYNVSKCCGIPSLKVLNWLEECCKELVPHAQFRSFSLKNRILLTCSKLKTNLSFKDLAIQFRINETSCGNYFHATIQLLSKVCQSLIYWPTDDENQCSMPQCFAEFPTTKVVLDCTEIPVEALSCLDCRTATYSHYKSGHTVKYLVGVTPSGLISYISPGFGGRSTDQAILEICDFLSKMKNGEAIMVDKGFLIQKQCTEAGITLHRPPFLHNQSLTKKESELTAAIARARVHVERKIARMKTFKILTGKIQTTSLPYIDDIVLVISGLSNLQNPILASDKFTVEKIN